MPSPILAALLLGSASTAFRESIDDMAASMRDRTVSLSQHPRHERGMLDRSHDPFGTYRHWHWTPYRRPGKRSCKKSGPRARLRRRERRRQREARRMTRRRG